MVTVDTERLRLSLSDIPPSSNGIYRKGQHGKQVLTTEGSAFKTRIQVELGRHVLQIPALDPNSPYRVEFHFELPTIFNPTFGRTRLDGRLRRGTAANRFDKRDVSNLRKLLEDVLAKAICVDDSTTCSAVTTKRWGPSPRVTVIVTEIPLTEIGWDAAGNDVPG